MQMYEIIGRFSYVPDEDGSYDVYVETENNTKLAIFGTYDEFESWLKVKGYKVANEYVIQDYRL